MSASVTSDEIKRELKATLAARHEVGAAYDDQFVEAFMDKLGAKVAQELQARGDLRPALAPAPPRPVFRLTTEHRLKIALVSLLLCPAILFCALLGSNPYTTNTSVLQVCLVLFALILLVNLALNLRLHLRLKR